MNTINDEFDVVIKIKKLDDYRLRPQKPAAPLEPIAAKNSVSSNILDLGNIVNTKVIDNTIGVDTEGTHYVFVKTDGSKLIGNTELLECTTLTGFNNNFSNSRII